MVIVAILITNISFPSFFVYLMLSSSQEKKSSISEPRAAIVDHLSLTMPNQIFNQTVTNILKQAGYTVDYYPSEKVTVEFYRNLPIYGHGLIILRVHSVISRTEKLVALFTSEAYSNFKHIFMRWTNQVKKVRVNQRSPSYFGISQEFIKRSMKGRFQNSIIVMMGCNGLTYTEMAEAFIKKGAKAYISWDKAVLSSHTDQATTTLLQHFLMEKLTIDVAIRETSKDVGPDPLFKSLLTYYPPEAGDYTIQNITGYITTNAREVIIAQDVLKNRKRYGIGVH